MTYYVVSDAGGEPERLVEAPTPAQAIRHVARRYSAKPATTKQVAEFLLAGGALETAGKGDVEPPGFATVGDNEPGPVVF